MTALVRILFDECLGHPVVEREIKNAFQLHGVEVEVAHLFRKFSEASPDGEWIPKLAKEGGWIVVSADRGTHSRKDQKLPEICREFSLTYVVISASLHRRSMYYKATAIIWALPHLINAADEPPGTGFLLSMHGEGFRFKKIRDAKDSLQSSP